MAYNPSGKAPGLEWWDKVTGDQWDPAARDPAPEDEEGPTPEDRIDEVAVATDELETSGEENFEGEETVQEENLDRARLQETDQRTTQVKAGLKFDISDYAAQEGLENTEKQIVLDRDKADDLPGDVKAEFAEQEVKLDAVMDSARTGLSGQREDALSKVMDGRAGAMDAAVSSIHGATRQQMSDIDAQVQQGILSPSQATAMKAKIKMGASMQLSAAVGQTAHLFTKTQADVGTAFGNMFTSMENQFASTKGSFGEAAAGAFGQANVAKAGINAELTKIGATATADRNAILSANAAARGAFVNSGAQNNLAMMEYTQDTHISDYGYAMNDLTARTDLARMYIQSDEFKQQMGILMENMEQVERDNFINMMGTVLGVVLG
ncbi:hypothetical protein LCGC14_0330350 [marine sediment metagenome]|uniref:Uncharacterized protein n=1 Tax=marine sediment metagenome TaxID=412755 RepID=A0A0F9TZK7_9ZZZZ